MKKLLKVWLVIMLLLGLMIPAALSEDPTYGTNFPDNGNVNVNPGKTYYVACNHTSWHWETIEEPTCQKTGLQNKVCDNCGTVFEREIMKTVDHKYGDWQTTKEATCKEAGVKTRYCVWCQNAQTEAIPKTTNHQYSDWKVTKESTCKEAGSRSRTCSVCGDTQTESIPKGDHRYGDWVVTKAATCKEAGTRTRTCSVCGATQTETLPRTEHQYSEWTVIKEPTCVKNGQKQHTCAICGETQYLQIKKVDHTPGEWTVTKAPDCNHTGTQSTKCTVCGKTLKETLPKTEHEFGDWEITVQATDHSKGKKASVCKLCKKKLTEEFYPEGTLYKGGPNPADEVMDLQKALAALGLYSGGIGGDYDNKTAAAVKAFQKKMGLPTKDGIGWPQTKKLLGLGVKPGEPVMPEDLDPYKLQLTVVQVSPVKDYYSAGDKIVYKWTLKNASTKTDALSVRTYLYKGTKADKKTDTEIAQPETLIPGEFVTEEYTYTVTVEDAAAGKFKVGFIGRCKFNKKDTNSNDVYFFSYASSGEGGIGGVWTPPEDQLVTIKKKVVGGPKNGMFYVKDEKIHYEIIIVNTSKVDVKNVIVTDKLFPTLKGNIGDMKGGEVHQFSLDYTVKAKDLANHQVENTALLSYTTADGKMRNGKASVTVPVGMNDKKLYLFKTELSSPANGLFYLQGETVIFEITIANPTKITFKNINVYDALSATPKVPFKSYAKMKPGDVHTFIFKSKVTYLQAKQGYMTNVVSARYKNPYVKNKQEVSNLCTVPCGFKYSDGLKVVKTIISTPANGSYYQEGEEIRYQIDITNQTEVDILDMAVRDSLADLDINGYRTIIEGETLNAGKTVSYLFSYIVTAGDVEMTKVTNVASAYWSLDKLTYIETFSDPVVAPTAEVAVERKPKAVKLDGDTCENALTGLGEGVAVHDVTECGEHTGTAEQSSQLVKDGQYDEAKALWDHDIDELYTEWIGQADIEGKRNAEDEKVAWEHQLSALEASMNLVCAPDQVDTIIVEERMNQCVGMCYELHSAPETRVDSLSGKHNSLPDGEETVECMHTATYLENGSAHVVDGQCASHALTMQLTEQLLADADDQESREAAWQRAQRNWILELNTMYDTWYLSADESQRPVIAEDRMSFDRLLAARQKTLADMYPDHPEIAAEVLANMIMDRTETICRILHAAGVLTD